MDFELPGLTFYIGIDPGANGGIAALCDNGLYAAWSLKDLTEDEIVNILKFHAKTHAMLEQPFFQPKFAFGISKLMRSFGFLQGVLAAHKIKREYVRPRDWQKALGCLTKGDKNVTKALAQRLFPDAENITHATADAILIAEHCRRTVLGRDGQLKEAA